MQHRRAHIPSLLTAPTLSVANASGLTIRVAKEHADPSLWLSVPGEVSGQDAVLVLLPEHVTVRKRGTSEAEHLYLWRPGPSGSRPNWRQVRNVLQYEAEFAPDIHFLAQLSLEPDGVLYHYEFVNRSNEDFDSVQAVTNPRMISPLFHDVRLQRTYVHDAKGFGLLASGIPERVTCAEASRFNGARPRGAVTAPTALPSAGASSLGCRYAANPA